jgi:hypothetical protein
VKVGNIYLKREVSFGHELEVDGINVIFPDVIVNQNTSKIPGPVFTPDDEFAKISHSTSLPVGRENPNRGTGMGSV